MTKYYDTVSMTEDQRTHLLTHDDNAGVIWNHADSASATKAVTDSGQNDDCSGCETAGMTEITVESARTKSKSYGAEV